MINVKYQLAIAGISLALFAQAQPLSKTSKDAGFVTAPYQEIPLGAIKPKGWLLHQLEIMRDGTTGHLDEVHDKLKNDNGWLGGKGDGWEETPYWLDGAVPLAYLLDGPELRNKVLRYINWTIDNQRPSGYFGPITKWERETGKKVDVANCEQGEDWWPKMVMLKVMQQYYQATGDKRVIDFMTRYCNYQLQALPKAPIKKWTEWSESRGADNVLMVQWLYGVTKQKDLLKLAALIQQQSYPWSQWFYDRDWVMAAAAQQSDTAWMTRHGVNVAMGLKDPLVQYQRTGDKRYLQALKHGFTDLMTLHGLPYGMFSADEDLHGNSPVQGTELCAITESMFSLEEAVALTGDLQYMDALERMTFNALPTQTTDDYNNKQYFQIANQVHIKRGVFNFSLPFGRRMNNVLGMRAGYTCCLANMHQGWTKFTSHLWYGTNSKGLAALHYSPNTIITKVGAQNTEVTIAENTNYPFDDRIQFAISLGKATSFPLELRIPSWCKEAVITLNGQPLRKDKGGQVISIDRVWKNGDKLTLQLPMVVSTSNWGKNSRTVERGPLVYALKIREDWQKETEPSEGEYFSVLPKDAWNYGLVRTIVKDPASNADVSVVKPVTNDFVWNLDHAPIELKVKARKIPGWKIVEDVAQQPITTREGVYQGEVDEATETITLVPYGCTKVRIVAFPVVK